MKIHVKFWLTDPVFYDRASPVQWFGPKRVFMRQLVGQKPPLKPKDIWGIRIFLQNAHQARDLAMFNLT